MKILYVASKPPIGTLDGESVRTLHFLKGLSSTHDVTFASPTLVGNDRGIAEDIIRATGVDRFVSISSPRRTLRSFTAALVRRKPHFFVSAKDEYFEKMIRNGDLGKFDAIHLDGLVAFNYFEAARVACRKVSVDLRDAWSLLYTRILDSKRGVDRVYASLKLKLIERVERDVVQKATDLVVISDVDRKYLAEKYYRNSKSISVIRNGVENHPTKGAKVRKAGDPIVLVFTGAMDYFPNDQAASYFLSEIFPNLKTLDRGWKMYVVGRSPSQALLDHASNDIVVTGTVPSIGRYLDEADIVVAPLLSGAGLKNKVLEGMASGKPVIGSPIAFEGIDGEIGVHFFCANTKSDWIERINELANDDELRDTVGRNGRELVQGQFDWSKIVGEFQAVVLD